MNSPVDTLKLQQNTLTFVYLKQGDLPVQPVEKEYRPSLRWLEIFLLKYTVRLIICPILVFVLCAVQQVR